MISFALPAGAEDFFLAPPIACNLMDDCYIQQYVDHDAGPKWRDFTCGPLSYDGHKGTDFALPSLARMEAGVDVLASAAGQVVAVRDGMADRIAKTVSDLDGKDCGNGVLLRHGGGWETQYCHMKQGSVIVETGQRVLAGDVLGEVGLSGATQFPHVHLSVRRHGKVVDPFAPETPETCGAAPAKTLWSAPQPYEAGGVISAGFATEVPQYDAIKAGTGAVDAVATDAPALVLWAHLYGARADDVVRLIIDGPEARWFETDVPLEKTQAQLFRAAGKRVQVALPPGTWSGKVALLRGGEVIDRRDVEVSVR